MFVAGQLDPVVFGRRLSGVRIARVRHESDEVLLGTAAFVRSMVLAEVEVDYSWEAFHVVLFAYDLVFRAVNCHE